MTAAMTQQAVAAPPLTIEQLLERAENDLLTLQVRYYYLDAFVNELERVSRGKVSTFWNYSLWVMILDSRDMLVIALATWAKGIYRPGGMLGKIQGGRRLPKVRGRKSSDPSKYLAKIYAKTHSDAFQRLFPTAVGEAAGPNDFAALKDRFVAKMEPVVKDRDQNRAHFYEYEKIKPANVAAMLDLPALWGLIEYAQGLLNDLRTVSCGHGSPDNRNMSPTNPEDFAADLVEALLTGTSHRRDFVMNDRDREKFYDDLHAKHDALGAPEAPNWNDPLDD